MIIIHALTKTLWETYENKDFYGDISLAKYGFIHCSDISTYHLVAPNFKNESDEMLLLVIDTEKLTSKIVWEDLKNCGTKFPHIYGLLNKDAIISVLPHLWNENKEWIINEELRNYNPMENYIHKVNYYETDKMGITHHSNYIRWMEEARIDYFEKIGLGYDKLEEQGIISPVIGLECEYKNTTTFNDSVEIKVEIEEFKGVRLIIRYTMINQKTGAPVFEGKSKHCFISAEGRAIILKKSFPDLDKRLKELVIN